MTETFSVEGGTLFDDYELHNTRLSECNSEEKHLEGKLVYLVKLRSNSRHKKSTKRIKQVEFLNLKNIEEKMLEHFKLRDNKQ